MRLFSSLPAAPHWGLALLLSLLATTPSRAQAPESPADSIGQRLRHYTRQDLPEQLFLHLDRPAYVAGETMWFKAYAVDGTYHRPLSMSKVAYVEVLDADQRPVLQAKVALVQAMGQGALELPAELATGRYVVRAYTNWMKNAGPDFYFQCPITVVSPVAGMASVAASKAGPAYDIQFFPEGGQLVRGLPGRVAFKITDQYGRSVAATGTVADARGTALASFQTLKFGMGSFLLTPAAAGAAYTASVRLPDGKVLTSKLPAVAEQGYALQVADTGTGQLTITVQAQTAAPAGSLHLLAHSGQQVTAEADAAFSNGQVVFQVAKQHLRPGITHFTVFAGLRPVGERLYFKRPTHALRIQGQASAAAYGPRRQVRLQIAAPQAAALSVAVYRLDSLSTASPADIASHLLLAADLKGFIEDADYYFRDSSAVAQQAADNLMLTQGWQRFKWEDVEAGRAPSTRYVPELNGYLLQGRISRPDGTPVAGSTAYLSLPGRAFWFGNATSHDDGLVQFELPHPYGLRKLVFQTNSSLPDSTYRVELLSPFTKGGGAVLPGLPPLSARLATTLSERHLQVQAQQAFPAPPPRYLPVPADTVAFYGRADEHYRLDDYTRFPTMEEVMREYVPGVLVRKRKDGFHFLVVDRPRHITLQENPLTLLDGLPVFNVNQIMAFDPLKVKTLDVMANRYFIGQQVYDGVVSYSTYKGDLGGLPLNPHALIEEYETLQIPREFYAPRYDSETQQHSRLPDLRNLLYWNPNIQLAAKKPQALEFFTSDQPGRYLVVTQGMTPDGQLGSTSFSFEVKPAL